MDRKKQKKSKRIRSGTGFILSSSGGERSRAYDAHMMLECPRYFSRHPATSLGITWKLQGVWRSFYRAATIVGLVGI
jgi:hypothetical protein